MASRASKRRKISPALSESEETSGTSTYKIQKAFFKSAANWNLEEDYANRQRKSKKKEKESTRLPIKTADGRIEQLRAINNEDFSGDSDLDWIEGQDDGLDSPEHDGIPDQKPELSEQQQILEAKEELAKIAVALNEDPEEHAGAFKALAKIGQSKNGTVQKLTIATQMTVYKDVIPGYRIRPASEDAPGEKLSKEVRKLRTYEQALVSGYQNYIKDLMNYAKIPPTAGKRAGQSISSTAITCTCTLLNAVPHFNFRNELLRIIVNKLSRRTVDADFIKCRKALEILFRDDEEGRPTMEAVSLLTKMMKARDFQIDESVLNLFLHLRLLSEFSGKASQDDTDQPNGSSQKFKKPKREFRTKRERKAVKEQKSLDKAMTQADALVSHEERDRMQSETLKLVFAAYFRMLKARVPHLMGAVLEGLAKYSHLINQDFFGDILEALKDMIRQSDSTAEAMQDEEADQDKEDGEETAIRNISRESLLCTVTAFTLLAGQDAHNSRGQLHLDLSFFVTHLFRNLLSLSINPDLELSSASLHIPDPTNPTPDTRGNRVNVHTTTVLLIHCLTAILLPPYNIRSVPPIRLGAFTKQLMASILQVPDKSAQAILALLGDVVHTHGKKILGLWHTEARKGDGNFNPISVSVEGSNPFASTVWEGELLKKHFSPKVREGVHLLEKSIGNI
jgi:nucleolar complex protein 3